MKQTMVLIAAATVVMIAFVGCTPAINPITDPVLATINFGEFSTTAFSTLDNTTVAGTTRVDAFGNTWTVDAVYAQNAAYQTRTTFSDHKMLKLTAPKYTSGGNGEVVTGYMTCGPYTTYGDGTGSGLVQGLTTSNGPTNYAPSGAWDQTLFETYFQ